MRRIWRDALMMGLGLGALVGLEACQFFGQSTEPAEKKTAERAPKETTEPAPKKTTAPDREPEKAAPSKAKKAEPSTGSESERVEPAVSEPTAKPAREAPEPAPELTDSFMADSRITVAVQMKLTGDRDSNFARVDVATSHGVVTLTGTVESKEEKRRAAELARRIDGVTRVDNHLHIE